MTSAPDGDNFVRFRPNLLLFLGILLIGGLLPSHAAVRVAHLEEPIHPVSAAFLTRVLEKADQSGDALVVIQMDTPGGLSDSMKEIIQNVIRARTPVCVFVSPSGARAASAGFLILISADVAAMSPGTNTGSAHPIFAGAEVLEEGKRNIMMEKVENDAAAFARTLAENRSRNVELAERVVRESLNFTEREALEAGLIDVTARDLPDLLDQLEGMTLLRFDGSEHDLRIEGEPVIHEVMTGRERLLSAIANPSLAFILLGLGMLGLYVEFTHPGLILPGVVGAIALLLFGFSVQILPINWIGLLLVVCGLALFILEVKVTSYGALTAGGIVCLFLGGLMLYDTPDIPEMRIPIGLLVAVSVATGLISGGLVWLVVRAHGGRIATGSEGLVGKVGTAVTDLGPGGRVFVHGEYWDALADSPLASGEPVRVVRVEEGMRLRVERAS